MFSKDTSSNESETIISSAIKVEGDLNSAGDIIIDGQVHGTITTKANLMVGEKAEITADVKATNAKVAGHIKGNLEITGKLELSASSKIDGNITAKILVVAEGAHLNGHCQMEMPTKEEATTVNTRSSKKTPIL
ncbi:MAG: polymer-forming cytoskeletal protein [Patescibacteria group bacterium]